MFGNQTKITKILIGETSKPRDGIKMLTETLIWKNWHFSNKSDRLGSGATADLWLELFYEDFQHISSLKKNRSSNIGSKMFCWKSS